MPPVVPLSGNVASFIEQTTKPRLVSPVAWASAIGTGSTQIIAQNLARRGLFIGNPGSVNILICPALDGNGNPLAAGGAGSLPLTPGQWLSFGPDTACTTAWNAAAASGSGNPVTVWEIL